MRDEVRNQVARQHLVVVQAEVAALRRRIGVLRRLQQHHGVATAMRRQHDAKEAGESDERAVWRLPQRDAGILAGPFDSARKDDRIGHGFLDGWAFGGHPSRRSA
jgi:hypothetical protein